MAIELFGADIAPYAALACIISFLMTGHRSIYPSQVLGIRKSSSIQVEIGKEIGETDTMTQHRKKSLINMVTVIGRIVKEKFIK